MTTSSRILLTVLTFVCGNVAPQTVLSQIAPPTGSWQQQTPHSETPIGDACNPRSLYGKATPEPPVQKSNPIPTLEEIRERKRQRMEAIHQRLQRLLKNSFQEPVVRPTIVEETPPKDTALTDAAKTNVKPATTATPTDADGTPQSKEAGGLEIPMAVSTDTPKISDPVVAIPETVPEDTVPMTADVDTPPEPSKLPARNPIADMIDSLAKSQPQDEPATPQASPKPEVAPTTLSATTVLNSPVDRLKLADNLFTTGEYSLALQMYDATKGADAKLSKDDQAWVTYQKAGCLRRLGMTDEAESLYRQIAGNADAAMLAQLSRWWLDRITERKLLKQEIGQVQEVLDTIQKAKLNDIAKSQ